MSLSIHLQRELATYFQYATQENPSVITHVDLKRKKEGLKKNSTTWTETDRNLQRVFTHCTKCNTFRYPLEHIKNYWVTCLFFCQDCQNNYCDFIEYLCKKNEKEFAKLQEKLMKREITAKEVLA